MKYAAGSSVGRRELLVRTAPACAMACLGLGSASDLAAAVSGLPCQEVHKFDKEMDRPLTGRQLAEAMNRSFFDVIRTLRQELGEPEAIRLLNLTSEKMGRERGKMHAERSPDTSFESFVSIFRQMASGESLTATVEEDSENTFELRVSECLWEAVFREADLAGDIGHAAVCNMDYSWPRAFNPAFKMERTKTLMQGHDCCNHRYINTADG
ncbi:MAG: L-2-amino-thiazoline-4-carboxylic acid hydrolase [Gemmatimonadetes bacterium]|nr:L-2-amino-thiazoline-4-carboxylic acid hydrolase [Gemmatimonadota bacterium]